MPTALISINMSSIVFERLDTWTPIMIKKVNLQFRQTQVISQPLKEILRLPFQNITPLQYQFLNRGVGVNRIEQPALANRRELRVVRVVNHFLVQVTRRLDAAL
jgi:hypothetical protein